MNALTMVHVAAGSLALLAGGAALSVRKGSPVHAQVGTAFFGAMLVMGGAGAVMAMLRPERGTAAIGLFTCYLVATSWATARRRDATAGGFERLALAAALGCAAAFLGFTVQGATSPTGHVDSLPTALHVPFALLAGLAAALDLSFILRRRLSRAQRIARHLWRMCAALLIAAFSFFLGQQKVMPELIQGSPLLFVPPLAVLGAMIFWILRLRFAKAWAGARRPPGARATTAPARPETVRA
ncbi:MAG TPA: hypothetical protein VN231_04900 [Allosphingosinicella sp.]|nr:hypothetical protein [Allosphingosinicella sp.]